MSINTSRPPSPSLSPPPQEVGAPSPGIEHLSSPPPVAETGKTDGKTADSRVKTEASDDVEAIADPAMEGKKADEAKERHHADLVKHAYEPPKAERPQDECVGSFIGNIVEDQ